jgi:hypothetical protein
MIYQNGHSGRIPRKIFVHKNSHFTEDEIQGAHDAFGNKTEIELVQIIRKCGWYGAKINPATQDRKAGPAAIRTLEGLPPAALASHPCGTPHDGAGGLK